MKFTDGMFEFPVRLYDGFSVRQAMKESEATEIPIDGDWVQGYAEIPLNEYEGCHDFFDVGSDLKEVAEKGFNGTVVTTKHMGDFICLWDRKKFKDKINAFAERYTQTLDSFVNEELKKKSDKEIDNALKAFQEMPVQYLSSKKKPWWRFW